jgi:hypothetical protein
MFKSFIMIITLSLSIWALDLPSLELEFSQKLEIIYFDAEATVVQGKDSYILKWKTANAKEVLMTFFGKVEKSDSIVITKEEYEMGQITLTAISEDSNVENVTINQKGLQGAPAAIINQPQKRNYQPMPMRTYPRRIYRPYRRY